MGKHTASISPSQFARVSDNNIIREEEGSSSLVKGEIKMEITKALMDSTSRQADLALARTLLKETQAKINRAKNKLVRLNRSVRELERILREQENAIRILESDAVCGALDIYSRESNREKECTTMDRDLGEDQAVGRDAHGLEAFIPDLPDDKDFDEIFDAPEDPMNKALGFSRTSPSSSLR